MLDKEEIMSKILWIINEKLAINEKKITSEEANISLLGKEIGFQARDLLMIFNEIEELFSIKITEEVFEKHGFKTVQDIVNLVEELC